MEIFFTLFLKLIPLYVIIGLGYLSVTLLKTDRETIARLLIYIIAPVIIFLGTYSANINAASLSLPLLFFVLCCIISLLFLLIGKAVYGKENPIKNILAFTAGTGNTGYFGLPVVYALFGEEMFSLAVLSILGFVLYENTLGFFLVAKGKFSMKKSIYKVIKLPTIYAFLLGIVLNISNLTVPESMLSILDNFKGAYVIFGMMIIGMGLGKLTKTSSDFLFMGVSFLAKFLVFPLILLGIIFLDKAIFQFFDETMYPVMIVMSIVPLAANTVALAVEFKTYPEKVTIAVLSSTVFALFYIPFMVTFFL